MSLQEIVERKRFLRRSTIHALENTVMDTWHSSDIKDVLKHVFGRLKVVLCNILKTKDRKTLVEENRGVSGKTYQNRKNNQRIRKKQQKRCH